jgi:hypothetical protein
MMDLAHNNHSSALLSLPKLKLTNKKIPIVQHLVKDEEILEPQVLFNSLLKIELVNLVKIYLKFYLKLKRECC